jgi:outer membrane immunogenic protein
LLPGSLSGILALGIAAAGIVAAAPKASAADLPVGPSYYPPSYHTPLYDWTGVYVGANIGVGLMLDTVTQQTANVAPAGSTTGLNPWGLVGGGQFGVNFQFASWVVGLEATFDSSLISGSGNSPAPALAGIVERSTSATNWYGTAAARFGYAIDTTLLYLKGGGAWMRAEYTQDFQGGAPLAPGAGGGVVSTAVFNDNRYGFVAGAGIEYGMVENWSLKFEYDFMDFGTKNYAFTQTIPAGLVVAAGPVASPVSIKSTTQTLSVGLNYRFNWSGGHSPY